MFDLKEALKNLPEKPGVYMMRDEFEQIIYIGKAKILKNRVRQYFQNGSNLMPKIVKMVSQVARFEIITTDSELEALILECNLIKLHRPKYNTMLKDDKGYPYIKLTLNETFPRVLYVRDIEKDKAKYFGPYTNSKAAKDTIEIIQKIWKLRNCNRQLPKDVGKQRECLNYHIGLCSGPCQNYISENDYRKNMKDIVALLEGKYDPVIEILTDNMMQASDDLDFERAAILRDQINSIKVISKKQKMANNSMDDQDIIAFAQQADESFVQVFFIRNGKLMGREQFNLRGTQDMPRKEIMEDFVKRFYSDSPIVPKEVLLQEEIDEVSIIENWLSDKRGNKVSIKVPQKGDKAKLIQLAAQNAQLTIDQLIDKHEKALAKTIGAAKDIQALLGIEEILDRVEAYDISHISGALSVGAMIVFEKGIPSRKEYRKFRIQSVEGNDDTASLSEVLTRRFQHGLDEQISLLKGGDASKLSKFIKFPQLILMDGGKGQVNSALKVLEKFGLDIPVCGLVKDDKHRTRGLYYNNQEIMMNKHDESFKWITRIQDEVHRFAIEYHKSLRDKKQVKSVLDDIPGIGPKKRQLLLKHFGSAQKILAASKEELMAVKGIQESIANSIIEHSK